MNSTYEFDGVIIGGGHNALVLAGYMARSGMKVAVVERTPELGGGLGTVQSSLAAGFYHEYHSQFHRNIPNTPWFKDLELGSYGVEYIYPQVNNGMPLADGRNLVIHADPAVTRASIERFSKEDANTYWDVYHRYQDMARAIWATKDYAPPLPPEEEHALLSKSKMGREFLEMNRRSAYEVVFDLFDTTALKAFYLFLFSVRGYLPAPTVKGTGFAIVAMTYLGNKAMLPKGGARRLGDALTWMISAHGARIFPATEVERVIIEHDTAVGVETTDGKRIMGKRFVASSVDPTQTFLRLVGEKNLDANIVARVKAYKYGVSGKSFGVLFALHAGVRERPAYASAAWDPLINESFNCCIGYETPEEVIEHLEEVIDGTPPEVIGMQAACPSIFDSTRAPAGKHVLLGWQFAPFALRDGGVEGWERLRGPYMEKMLERWRQYAPNLEPKNIIYSFGQTPVDTAEHLINMREGDFHVGALIPSQLGFNRPFPEVSNYRTPIKNLYLTGAGTHPGGNVTGAPGYNAAQVIARDLRLDLWWNPPDPRKIWAELA
ncbi:MAG: NAD(P)/FAD-dependent oxidoreductase [Betaproteobacteria bacterium]|nr:NAD(P)/FAD-dependent oxidoreductase [Betaproteobacteria bacterium]